MKKRKLRELIKMEKKLQKLYPTEYNLLTAQALWQTHNQILSIILLKEFMKLNTQTVICAVLKTQMIKMT